MAHRSFGKQALCRLLEFDFLDLAPNQHGQRAIYPRKNIRVLRCFMYDGAHVTFFLIFSQAHCLFAVWCLVVREHVL